jgi:hypothetical protein
VRIRPGHQPNSHEFGYSSARLVNDFDRAQYVLNLRREGEVMKESQRRTVELPVAPAFVVCREIIEDCRSHDFVLIGPFSGLNALTFPLVFRMSIYAHLTSGQGVYEVALQLRDMEETVVWEWCSPKPIHLVSPLEQHRFALNDALLDFPEPGRYDLVLLANGQVLARHALHARAMSSEE